MSIQALPQSTVRALGATQALTDPASLVKELLDNALDANANSVAVSISSNTLDMIQVRDNGHGIAPHDRPMVARRYCTSKICDDSDLKDIGGTSLGFRGEALASAAELSGTMLISTRIEGEQVAASLKISQQGEVIGQDRASFPVGTTVKITDFIKANPVRRQVALKNVEACLKKIKRLLQAYALARPQVRLSLQILKARNNKGDWVYAPKPNGNAEDAAFKIVGAQCASSCLWSVVEDQGLTLRAFLPRPDADVSKISNVGSFVSIDARPVSTNRGLLKQITKIFRESLKATDNRFDNVKDPFMFLEISGGSYDANLEPAKDDVLFEDADSVLHVVKQLFAAMYKPMEPPVVTADLPAPFPTPFVEAEEDNFTTSLEQELPTTPFRAVSASASVRTNATEQWLESMEQQKEQGVPASAASRAPLPRSNMYGEDMTHMSVLDDRPTTGLTEADFAELRQSRNNVTLSNPWVYAKMHTSNRAPILGEAQRSRSPARCRSLESNERRERSPTSYQQGVDISGIPTPRPSSPSPPIDDAHPSDHVPDLRTPKDGRAIGPSNLPLPQACSRAPSSTLRNHIVGMLDRGRHTAPPDHPYAIGGDVSGPNLGTGLSDIPDMIPRPRRAPMSRVNRSFLPASKEDQREQVWFDHGDDMGKPRSRRPPQGNMHSLVAQGEPEVNFRHLTPPGQNRDIRDFVRRDPRSSMSSMIERRSIEETPHQPDTAQHEESTPVPEGNVGQSRGAELPRGFIPASELIASEEDPQHVETRPPAKRRKTKDRVPLREISANSFPVLEESEEEAQCHPPAPKRTASRRRSSRGISRTKSSRLPLERVPPGQATHELALDISIDVVDLRQLVRAFDHDNCLLGYNEPAVNIDDGFGTVEDSDLQDLTATLHRLLVTAGGDTNVVDSADLLHEVRTAFAQHAVDAEDEQMLST